MKLFGADGSVAISWPSASVNGPSLGSVRAIAEAAGADLGDELVMRLTAQTIEEVTVVVASLSAPRARLVGLLAIAGEAISQTSLLDAVASRLWQPLGLTAQELAAAAERRREPEIAALLRAAQIET